MLVTQQKVLRRFCYPVIPAGLLADGPRPFTLLGKAIVLWRDGDLPCVLLPMAVTAPVRVSKG